jgi:hypothetical protein
MNEESAGKGAKAERSTLKAECLNLNTEHKN